VVFRPTVASGRLVRVRRPFGLAVNAVLVMSHDEGRVPGA
jgi:hypothetical protein